MTSLTRHTAPMVLHEGQAPRRLERVQLGSTGHQGPEREAFIQGLVHDYPDLLPMTEIEPAYSPLIAICRELPTAAGFVDNLWLTPAGGVVLGECKLVKNPEARREVVAQALDYARALAGFHYDGLEAAVRKALRNPSASLWELVRDQSDLDEAQFVDAVERRLSRGRFLVLIIGDGIQEGLEALASHLQLHAGIHVALALVDLSLWREPDGGLLVLPRVLMRTLLVERGIVVVDALGTVQVKPFGADAVRRADAGERTVPRATTASEPEFFDQMSQLRPELPGPLKQFLSELAGLAVQPEFRRTLILRWNGSPDYDCSPGYIEANGRVWLSLAWGAANRLGFQSAGDRYLETMAGIVGGSVKRYEKNWPDVVGSNGRSIDCAKLLERSADWKAAIAQLIDDTGDAGVS